MWAGRHLRGPQIELLEGRQFDEVLGAGTGDVGEGQAEVLQVSKGARAQQAGQVRVLQWVGMMLRAGWGIYQGGLTPIPPSLVGSRHGFSDHTEVFVSPGAERWWLSLVV